MTGLLSGFQAQTGSVANCSYATFARRLGEAAAPSGGNYWPCRDFASHTLTFALQLRKITENLSQGKRIALECSAQIAIRYVDMSIVGDGFEWPAVPCPTWLSRQATASNLGQPICRFVVIGGSPNQLTLSQSSLQSSHMVHKQRNAHNFVYLPDIYVPRGTSSEAKTPAF